MCPQYRVTHVDRHLALGGGVRNCSRTSQQYDHTYRSSRRGGRHSTVGTVSHAASRNGDYDDLYRCSTHAPEGLYRLIIVFWHKAFFDAQQSPLFEYLPKLSVTPSRVIG